MRICTILLLLWSSIGLAQEGFVNNTAAEVKAPETTTQTAMPEVEKNMASKDWRKERNIYAAIGIGSAYGDPAEFAEIGWLIDSDDLATIKYTHYKEEDSIYNDGEKDKTQTIGLNYKSFQGNSFYYTAGLYYRDEIQGRYSFSLDAEKKTRKDYGATMSIGNQWQFKRFTIGCDWVGLYRSINEKRTGGFSKDFDDAKIQLHVLNFYVGLAF